MKSLLAGRERLILGVCLALALLFVSGQAVTRIEHLRGLAERATVATVPPEVRSLPGVHAREVILPPQAADAMWWVMHTETMLREGHWRARWSAQDNAPHGREIHWSSGLMWLLALLAWLIHLASGLETVDSVQHAALLAGPVMLVGFLIVFSLAAARRWGGAAGGLLALGMATSGPLDVFFQAGEADHHGIVTCFTLACVLSLLAGGAGRVAKAGHDTAPRGLTPGYRTARRWFALSGLCGAAGLWVSAATVAPALAGIALGALLIAWHGRRAARASADDGTEAAPALWRWWGAAGAAGSLAFYLLEYAPDHFGWRLEVNHPLYALALWGAGELLARLAAWGRGERWLSGGRDALLAGAGVAALAALPAAILAGGTARFAVSDAFLWKLHNNHILEFFPLPKYFAGAVWAQIASLAQPWPLLLLPIGWLLLRRLRPGLAAPAVLAAGAALPLSGLALAQERWLAVALTLWLAAVLAALLVWRAWPARPARWLGWAGAGLLALGFGAFPAIWLPRWGGRQTTQMSVEDACSIVMRDVAWGLRRVAGSQPVNLISGPTSTTALAYYGDVRGVGTLYWENLEGLKATAAIFGATEEQEVLRLCRERGVTHLILFSWDAFAQPYARLHHGRELEADTEDCFLTSLLVKRSIPLWLRPMPYPLMPQLEQLGHWVQAFEFRPDQTPAEAYFYLARYLTASGLREEALQAYLQSWKRDSTQAAIGRELGVALAETGRLDEARQLAARLPAADRAQIEAATGRWLSLDGRHAEAVAAWRRALELTPNDLDTALNLAWLLSTSDDAAVRNGDEALALLNRVVGGRAPQNTREIDVLAAANAEKGRFADALALIGQAIEAARRSQATQMVEELESRRTRYSDRQPFRTLTR